MEAYEDNLEKMTEHKKTVRESTKATRDVVSYKSTDDKIRDYERESRRNVDTDAPIIRRNADIVLETKPLASSTPSYRSSALVQDSYEEPKTESVRGNWRKDMAKFEDNLTSKKRESQVVTVKPTATVEDTTSSWRQRMSHLAKRRRACLRFFFRSFPAQCCSASAPGRRIPVALC